MPNGRVASLRKSIGAQLAGVFLGEAIALTANVSHVGRNVEVTLTLRRSDGSIEGPLATALTNDQGEFFLTLPPDAGADSCRFIVSVGDAGAGTLTRAFVHSTDEPVDIDFISETTVELILREVALGTDLCSFSSENIRGLADVIRNLPGDVSGASTAEVNQKALTAALTSGQPLPIPCLNCPTRTVTPTALPTATAFSGAKPAIILDTVQVHAGESIAFNAVLKADGALIAGTQNDIVFDLNAPIAAKANGKPDCTVNAAIGKDATAFAFRPPTSVRVLVLSTNNLDPIPDGSVLYQPVEKVDRS